MTGPEWLTADEAAQQLSREDLIKAHRKGQLTLFGRKSSKHRAIGSDVYLDYPAATLLNGNFFGVKGLYGKPMDLLFADVRIQRDELDKLLWQRAKQPKPDQALVNAWLLDYAKRVYPKLLQQNAELSTLCKQAPAEGIRATQAQMITAFHSMPEQYRFKQGRQAKR